MGAILWGVWDATALVQIESGTRPGRRQGLPTPQYADICHPEPESLRT